MRHFHFLLVTALMLSTLSCTRNMGDSTVTVSLGSKVGGLSNFTLQTAFINIHVPGAATIVKKYNYEGMGIAKGSDIEFSVENVPNTAGTLVQFLGVFEDDTGVMDFSYGDALLANSVANITANSAGTAAAQGQISGRLLASTPKSGRMTAYYTPTANPAYPMAVETSDIVDGWFNVFALDGGAINALTYKLDDGTTVFNNMYLSSGSLYIDGNPVSSSTYLLKVSYPTTYRQHYINGVPSSVKARPKTTLYYGFLNGGLAPSTPNKICYPQFNEGIIGIYSSAALNSYVSYMYTGGSVNDITVTGGTAVANNNFITGNGTCAPSTSDNLFFIPQMAQQDVEKASMVMPPFTAVQPQVMGSEWLSTSTTVSGGNTDYTFKWAYLPSITTSHVSGADILKYPSVANSSGDQTCDSLIGQGAEVAGSESGVVTTKTVTVGSGSWNFAVCAYQTIAGVKKYYKNFLRSGCVGMCNPFHYGWAASTSGAVSLSSSQNFNSGVMAAPSQRVTYVLSSYGSYPYYTELSVSSNAGFTSGEEVMLTISGAGSSVQCGSYDAGYTGFARVVGLDSGKIRINKGSFVDNVSTSYLSGAPTSGNFCTLQAVRVPHFNNLTIDASGQLSADNYYHTTGGGIIAFRVNGVFTHNGLISSSAKGYEGGVYSGSYSGASPRHDILLGSYAGSMGGVGNASGGGGGAGAEYGASGATTTGAGGQNTFTTNYINTLFGGGGGAGASTNGTRGGGSVFITARKLITSSGMITSFGDATAAGSSGAGGGGSITLAVKEATGSGLILQATGGNATGSIGGVGGGGSVRAYFCNNNGIAEAGEMLLTGSNIFTSVGNGSYPTGAVAGTTFANAFPSTSSGSNYYFCNQ